MKKLLIALLALLPVLAYAQLDSSVQEIVENEADFEIKEEKSEELVSFPYFTKKAEFPGGDLGLQKHILANRVYPKEALDSSVSGTVNVMFTINEDGRVVDLRTLGSIKGYGLEEEAIRIIKSTDRMWTPAMERDKPVSMKFRIPIKFEL